MVAGSGPLGKVMEQGGHEDAMDHCRPPPLESAAPPIGDPPPTSRPLVGFRDHDDPPTLHGLDARILTLMNGLNYVSVNEVAPVRRQLAAALDDIDFLKNRINGML